MSAGMLLRWLGEHHDNAALQKAGDAVEAAVDAVLRNPATRTADLGGSIGTRAFTQAVVSELNEAAR